MRSRKVTNYRLNVKCDFSLFGYKLMILSILAKVTGTEHHWSGRHLVTGGAATRDPLLQHVAVKGRGGSCSCPVSISSLYTTPFLWHKIMSAFSLPGGFRFTKH